jgi:hypothetical protein
VHESESFSFAQVHWKMHRISSFLPTPPGIVSKHH